MLASIQKFTLYLVSTEACGRLDMFFDLLVPKMASGFMIRAPGPLHMD